MVAALLLSTFAQSASAQQGATVSITVALDPSVIEVEPGATVTWVNNDSERHRIRSLTGPVEFDTGNLDPGDGASITFTEPGTYTYRDHRDPDNHKAKIEDVEPCKCEFLNDWAWMPVVGHLKKRLKRLIV